VVGALILLADAVSLAPAVIAAWVGASRLADDALAPATAQPLTLPAVMPPTSERWRT